MIDEKEANVQWLDGAQEDFDSFLAKNDWVNAQAVIDAVRENGYSHSADILHKAFLKAQSEVDELVWVPFEQEIPTIRAESSPRTDHEPSDATKRIFASFEADRNPTI